MFEYVTFFSEIKRTNGKLIKRDGYRNHITALT